MESLDQALARALELALQDDFEQAEELLAARSEAPVVKIRQLLEDRQHFERTRRSAMSATRHDLGNALSIAQASIEAMLDGVVGITDPRLTRVRNILESVSNSLYELTSDGISASADGESADDPLAKLDGSTPAPLMSRETGKKLKKALLHILRHIPAGATVQVVQENGRQAHIVIALKD